MKGKFSHKPKLSFKQIFKIIPRLEIRKVHKLPVLISNI